MPRNQDFRQSTMPQYAPYTQYYPGVNPYEIKAEASSLVPISPPAASPTTTATATTPVTVTATPKATGSGLSLPNIGELKDIVERLGGIDGILATVGKVQKVMQTFQQFAPMAKLIAGFLPGGKNKSNGDGDQMDEYKPRRRKSGSRKKSTGRRSSSRKRTTTGKSGKTGKRRR